MTMVLGIDQTSQKPLPLLELYYTINKTLQMEGFVRGGKSIKIS